MEATGIVGIAVIVGTRGGIKGGRVAGDGDGEGEGEGEGSMLSNFWK